MGDDGRPFKTRSGDTVGLEGLLDEAVRRAYEIVSQGDDGKLGGAEISEERRREIAQSVGIGALKYADLSQYRTTDYVFSWDRMLSLHGNTAPYLQNAYVRIRSIFRKAGEAAPKIEKLILSEPAEVDLAKRVCQFAEIVPHVLDGFRPNILANYLFELANSFHGFYEACPVLKSEEPARSSRLALCDLTARVLQRGLDLLGIKVPERM